MSGCTSIGDVHMAVRDAMRREQMPALSMQKAYVRTMTVSDLLGQQLGVSVGATIATTAVPLLRLLKIDIEGMDQMVVNSVLDFYSVLTGSPTVTSRYPCVIYYETNTLARNPSVLWERLQTVGYALTFNSDDTLAVNYECDMADIHRGLSFLYPAVAVANKDSLTDNVVRVDFKVYT